MEPNKNKPVAASGIRRRISTRGTLLAGLLSLFAFTACDVKDPIYDSPYAGKAEVTVITDWSGIGRDITTPSSWTMVWEGEALDISVERYTFPELLEPGAVTALLYNRSGHIPVSGTTATVASESAAAGFVEPMPDWLFSGNLSATIVKDEHNEFSVPMRQQVRSLTLLLEPTGSSAGRVAGITATLSGVAGTLDLASGAHGTPSDVAMNFTKVTSGEHAGKWAAAVRLLGVAGAEQKLMGTIRFADGTPADIPLESDLTADLAAFNTGKQEPLALQAGAEVHTSPGFTATITGWKKAEGGTGIAN
ncbi:FimB/Mfa2 family fimbrial subunit [uncultured Alistipes sp.]|uniref:FimB/Mfa2 family fimbrial subunit n=1 Tax=uncultured Alistipes sp. TaxID=538949 RepID=UPI0025DA140D|nr:FimB/Mfa2 family fimbrial subunit [uncultured Alistipes sp.]